MLERVTSRELTEWMAWYKIEAEDRIAAGRPRA
jgi:hypothetical protein